VFPDYQEDVYYSVASVATDELAAALTIAGKAERDARTDELKGECRRGSPTPTRAGKRGQRRVPFADQEAGPPAHLTDHFRIDGRGHHRHPRLVGRGGRGAARTRQCAVRARRNPDPGVTTLDMVKMAQQIDSLGPEPPSATCTTTNFPPFSTGETGRVGSPKRREIGMARSLSGP